MAEFKDRLQHTMDLRGVKAIDLAKLTNMTRGAISQYLSGKVTPKVNKLNDIANALMVNPVWLMGYDVDMITGKEITPAVNKKNDSFWQAILDSAPELKEFIDRIESDGNLVDADGNPYKMSAATQAWLIMTLKTLAGQMKEEGATSIVVKEKR